ncbi:hypothetical protein J2Z30_005182 [Streptomyces iranensis]|nr:hypothetical protein [Streptomyces iranensis]
MPAVHDHPQRCERPLRGRMAAMGALRRHDAIEAG